MIAYMHQRGSRPWVSAFNLVWSLWVFSTPIFMSVGPSFYWSIAISYPLFLLAIWLLSVRPVVEGAKYIYVLTVLACVCMPFNAQAWSYGVFAFAYLPWFFGHNLRRFGVRFVLVMAALLAVAAVLHFPWFVLVMMVGICTSVALGNLAGKITAGKNAAERMSQAEVRRLAANAERERIGRDLHDLLGHTLSLITLKLELSRKLFDRDPERSRRELTEAEAVARHALAEVRAAVTGIRATGLAGELASARLMLHTSGVELATSEMPRLPDAVDDTLALALRESVTNIHRHAQATRASVSVKTRDGRVLMLVRDDGRGGAGASGNGLRGMRERVQAMAGTLEIHSLPGEGTEVCIDIPLPALAASAASDPAERRFLPTGDGQVESHA